MTLEFELEDGVATKVADEAGLSLEAAEEDGLEEPDFRSPLLWSLSCNDKTPPSSFSPKLSLHK